MISAALTPNRRRGMALVITLSALALLSVLILAFFSRAQNNRQISYSSTNLLSAKSAARSALDIVAGELRQEIADTARSTVSSTNGVSVYQPKDAAYLLPAALGVANASGPLVKVSAANTAIRPGGTIKASACSIAAPSLKGSFISNARWYTSAASPKLGSQTTMPCWLFLTRGNGIKTPDSISSARDMGGDDCVVARFAYTVYDIGGLMDANIAGYPALAANDAVYRPSCAYADLTALGFSSGGIQTLLAWRNAVTGTDAANFLAWGAGIPETGGTATTPALAAARSGHLSIVHGDNVFLSRHDLLNHPAAGSCAGLLTHFSRTLNAPTHSPAAAKVSAINPFLADVRFSAITSGTHYKDDGATETYAIQNGDVLLQRRFSLAKLAWLTHDGPAPGISTEAIKACFGLSWDATAASWIYVGDGTGAQTKIKTLAEAAKANREPNFFELLQAGILQGSLGKSGGSSKYSNGGMAAIYGVETNTAYQVIRIGANIIDQADADSYPTAISFNGFHFFGIEDLPYFNKILFKNIGTAAKKSGQYVPPFRRYFVYELWNPHRAPASTPASRPMRFRVRINDDATYQTIVRSNTSGLEYVPETAAPLSGADGDPLEFDADSADSDAQKSYREPRVIRTGDASTLRSDLSGPTLGACNAVMLPSIDTTALTGIMWLNNALNNAVFILEYQDASGWHPYSTFAGHEEAGGVTGITCSPSYGLSSTSGVTGACYANLCDPRTFRLNAHDSTNANGVPTGGPVPVADTSLRTDATTYIFDNHFQPSFIAGDYYLALLAANNASIVGPDGNSCTYADPDGVTRPADAWYGVNPFASGDSSARPLVLNRPFRSVGELGHVFRDLPWKTLDLFSNKSADAALLDLFALCDEPKIIAGRVNLNSQQSAVPRSLLSGAQSIADSDAQPLASALAASSGAAAFANVSGLPAFVFSGSSGIASSIKAEREASIRALASASQTRTWNLLIDVVAQTGRYTRSSATLDDFLVEGETRYWLSIAIDRYTGKIIDQQLENAHE